MQGQRGKQQSGGKPKVCFMGAKRFEKVMNCEVVSGLACSCGVLCRRLCFVDGGRLSQM